MLLVILLIALSLYEVSVATESAIQVGRGMQPQTLTADLWLAIQYISIFDGLVLSNETDIYFIEWPLCCEVM